MQQGPRSQRRVRNGKMPGLDVIGNLSGHFFRRRSFEFLLSKFAENPGLGWWVRCYNEDGYSSDADSFAGRKHFWSCQLFRRQCWRKWRIFPSSRRRRRWIAVTTARMGLADRKLFRESPAAPPKNRTASMVPSARHFHVESETTISEGIRSGDISRGVPCMKRPYLVGGIARDAATFFSLATRTLVPSPKN